MKYFFSLLLLSTFCLQAQVTYTVQPDATAGVDALVDGSNATTNYSTSTSFKCGRFQSGGLWYNHRSYIYFDLSSIPANAVVLSASLEIKGVNHAGANASYLRKVTGSWTETGVTYSVQPSNTTTGQISLSQSSSATQTYTVDVKTHTQDFIENPINNKGWVLMLQDESTNTTRGLDFASSDYAVSEYRPKLTIVYEFPPVITGNVYHETTSGESDGAIDVTITEGVAPFTYSWSHGPTTQDVSGLSPGLYSITVTDYNNTISKKYFAVGCPEVPVTIIIQPDGTAGKDATVFGFDNPQVANNTNYENYATLYNARWTSGAWYSSRGYLQFDLSSIPANSTVTTSTLTLYGTDHNQLQRSNASYLRRVTSGWNEYDLTWANQPSNTDVDQISLAASTSSTQDYNIDVTTHVQNMIDNPSANYGWVLRLQNETTSQYTRMVFGSSDNANSAKFPGLAITFILKPTHVILKKKPDGGVYHLKSNKLYFKYEDEYANSNHKLSVKIWNSSHTDVYPTLFNSSTGLKSYLGDMRFCINLFDTGHNPLPAGYYLMEVTNEKNEVQYLKFKL